MEIINNYIEKYKNFELQTKQKSLFLFIPLIMLKFLVFYLITIFLNLFVLLPGINYFFDICNNFFRTNSNLDILYQLPSIFLLFTGPGLIYYFLFSRFKFSLHPAIVTFFAYYIADPQDEGFFLGIYTAKIMFIITILITALIMFFKYSHQKIKGHLEKQ